MKLNVNSMLLSNGIIFALILLMWPILMVLSQLEGSIHQQMEAIEAAPALYILNFVLASLIAPALTMLLISMNYEIKTRVKTPTLNILGVAALGFYVALVSVGYISQYTLLQLLLSHGNPAAEYWYFNNPDSAAYFLN
ncbi:MAG: hypothetical protein FH749_15375 [Firmicutes bacterium]|nr:hypothetical protein [Bacillota bacterium]